ncbi:MAG: hypothetical protein E7352_07165 [Clostridiales bacterium]|nr:hypothetical protein [Clostridiales bacterium]
MTLEEIFSSFKQEMPQVEIPEEVIEVIKELINKEFTMVQSGNTTRITLNLRDELVEILGYISSLNTNTKLGSMVNYALGRVEQGLTWESILNDVKDLGTYTVNEAVTTLDAVIYNASEMHLQDVKDMLFAETDIYNILVEEFDAETADMVKNVKIADLLTEYGSLTVDDLLEFAVGEEGVTLASFVAMAEEYLSETTLGDLIGLEGVATLQEITSVVRGINIGALDTGFAVTVVNGKATRIEYSFNMAVSISYQGQAMSMSANVLAYAEKFSNDGQEISLPDDVRVETWN